MTTVIKEHLDRIEQAIEHAVDQANLPPSLSKPIRYATCSGGKRLRPLLTVLAAQACNGNLETAYHAGAAIEILHNFTLVHDDIMDHSPLRRGKPTVHVRWDESSAILAGDTMVGIAYHLLSRVLPPEQCTSMVAELSSAFIEVCIGQAEDLLFRHQSTVSMEEYFGMISRKTARLFATAAVAGGIVANASEELCNALRTFGTGLGIAFQVQDDMLDLLSSQSEFGKQPGQDLREGKKTFPVLCAYDSATDPAERQLLELYFQRGSVDSDEQIAQIATLCQKLGVLKIAQDTVESYLQQARGALEHLQSSIAKESLMELIETTSQRRF